MFTHVLGTILRILGLLIAAFGFLGLIEVGCIRAWRTIN